MLDTGVIVALLDASEAAHRRCVEAVVHLDRPLVTCEAVIAEACYLTRALDGAASAILRNVERNVFRIPFHISEHAPNVMKALRKYADVPAAFADACLIVMAETLSTGDILTLDNDFRVYRWARSQPFRNLLDEATFRPDASSGYGRQKSRARTADA
ncbi:MAG TPA: PIN domain-containing protein [Bryobacteraceae bacterium]|nr:PIN domain-containing protein [Bryobacteraceae bacterium]